MINNISLNIVANAQFQQVYAEVAKLKEAMLSLQKVSVGGPFTAGTTASIKAAQTAFDDAVLSTRAFSVEHVKMSNSIAKFGKDLNAGKLSLNNYYKLWRDSAKGTSAELDALATSQARLNRSIAIADPLRPGYAKLVTDINGVVTAQEKQLFYQRGLNTALQQGSMKLIDFGKNTQWMGRQLTVGLTMPIAMFGAAASKMFLDLDKELTRMQKVYGTGLTQPTTEALAAIRKQVVGLGNDLASSLGISVQETASMAADLAATGKTGADLIGATREALRLATLGELDHQAAMQATVSLQNVYKLNTQGLTESINFLNAVENQTSTSLQDLVDGIPRVGPIVQQLGGTFKDTAVMMVAMKEAGVPAAQSANAIKSAMASMINPTKEAQAAFKLYNINLKAMSTTTGGNPIKMIEALQGSLEKLSPLVKAQLIEKLFGKFQEARIQALISNLGKAGSQTKTVFDLMGASSQDLANLASNELKKQTESASGRFKRMMATLKADIIPLGESFLNSFSKLGFVVDKVLKVFKEIAKVLGPVGHLLGGLFGGAAAGLIVVGPLIMLTGLFANLIGNILRGANSLRMFKQGMDAAGSGQNKFTAGLAGMRNFYEDLDKSAIAARNQIELMPEAITTNAQAFETLRKAIFDLTAQFQQLALAQKEALSIGPMVAGKGNAAAGILTQMRLPGFADGVTGAGVVPGSGNGDTIPALLTPGESVVTKEATAKYGPIIAAMNAGTLKGFKTAGVNIGGESIPVSMFHGAKSGELQANVDEVIKLAPQLANTIKELLQASIGTNVKMRDLARDIAKAGTIPEGTALRRMADRGKSAAAPTTLGSVETQFKDSPMEIEAARRAAEAGQKSLVESGASESRIKQGAQIDRAHAIATPKELKSSWSKDMVALQAHEENQLTTTLQSSEKALAKYNTALKLTLEEALKSAATEEERLAITKKFAVIEQKVNNGQALTNQELIEQTKILDNLVKEVDGEAKGWAKLPPSLRSAALSVSASGKARLQYVEELRAQGVAEAEIAAIANRNKDQLLAGIAAIEAEAAALGQNAAAQGVAAFAEGLKTGLQVASPSKVMKVVGQQSAQGFVQGVLLELPEAEIAGKTLAAAEVAGHQLMGNSSNPFGPMGPKGGFLGKDIAKEMNGGIFAKMMKGIKSPGGMMGASMFGSMALNAAPDKVNGADVSGVKGALGSGLMVGGLAGSGMLGATIAGFAPEIALAVVALKGFSMAMSNAAKTSKEANDRISTSYQTSTSSLNSYNLSVGKSQLTLIDLGAVQLKNEVANKKVSKAADQASESLTGLAATLTSASDKQFTAALKSSSAAEAQALLSQRYYADLQSGGKKFADQMSLAYQQKAGFTFGVNAANRGSTLSGALGAANQVGTGEGSRAGGAWGNVLKGILFGGQYSVGGKETRSSIGNIFGFKTPPLPGFLGGLQAKGSDYYKAQSVGSVISGQTGRVTSMEQLTNPKYVTQFRAQYAALSDISKAVVSSNGAFDSWNATLAKTDPQLAQIDAQLRKTGASFENIVTVTQMAQAHFFTSVQEMQAAATAAGMKIALAGFTQFQDAVAKDVTNAQGAVAAAQKAADAAAAKAAKAASGDTSTASDKAAIKDFQDKIKAIEKEKSARDELYNAQLRNIEAQQQQMNLEEDVIRARGSGDLLKVAAAQRALLVQRTKDNMANAKANLDKASQSKIDALQAKIDALQAKQSGPSKTIDTSKEDAALAAAKANLAKAQSGEGTLATGVKTKTADKLKDLVPEPPKSLWEKIKAAASSLWDHIKSIASSAWDKIKEAGKAVWDVLHPYVSAAWDKIQVLGKAIWDKIGPYAKAAWHNIQGWASDIWDKIHPFASKLWDGVTSGAHTAWDKIKGIFGALEKPVGTWFVDMWDNAKGFIDDIKTGISDIWHTVADSKAFDLFKTVFKDVAGWIGDISSGIGDVIGFVGNVAFTIFGDVFKLVAGLTKDMFGWIGKIVGFVADKAFDGFSKIWGGIHDFIAPIAGWLGKAVGFVADEIWNTFKGIWKGIHDFVSPVFSWLNRLANTVLNDPIWDRFKGLWSSIKTLVDNIGTVVANIWTKVKDITNDLLGGFGKVISAVIGWFDPNKKANGGPIHAATGMYIGNGPVSGPGGPKSDLIPAMLSNGEYVIQADAVGKYGIPLMNAINNKTFKMPMSSLSPAMASKMADAISDSTSIGGNTINVYPPVGADAQEVATMVMRKLDMMQQKQGTDRRIGAKR